MAVQGSLKGCLLPPVDAQSILELHLDDGFRKPACIDPRHPLPGVLRTLPGVHAGIGEGQVQQVVGEPPLRRRIRRAQARVVGLAQGDHVLDVGLSKAAVDPPCIAASDVSHPGRYGGLQMWRVPVVRRAVVGGASNLRLDFKTHPCLALSRAPLKQEEEAGGHSQMPARERHVDLRESSEPGMSFDCRPPRLLEMFDAQVREGVPHRVHGRRRVLPAGVT